MQNVEVKAVGKYKDQFNQTGLLLDAGKGEFWANFPGSLAWKDYKGKRIDVNLTQDGKGYWSGTFADQNTSQGQQQAAGAPNTQNTSQPAPSAANCSKDELIVRQVVYKEVIGKQMGRAEIIAQFKADVKLLMTGDEVTQQGFEQQYNLNENAPPSDDQGYHGQEQVADDIPF